MPRKKPSTKTMKRINKALGIKSRPKPKITVKGKKRKTEHV